ncbi:hypothetical protein ACFL6X_00195 [Candidatus Latescibacterota bacterium]
MRERIAMYTYDTILRALEGSVPGIFTRQVTDASRADDGAFISPDLGCPAPTHTGHSHDLARLCYLFMADGSSLQGDGELFARIDSALSFLRRWQRPSGLVDGVVSNWESPNATAFTVQLLAPIVSLAREQDADEQAGHIARELGEYVRSAAVAVIGRGFHTPNHRWVICSALAQAMTLFPEIPALTYVDQILAEGVDVNEDGQFSERSAGIYNAACDRSLRLMADHLGRPELLEPVRRNLKMMVHLFHPDWTVVTGMSGRQDRGQRLVPVRIADSFYDMAHRDRNGVFASVADALVESAEEPPAHAWLLHPFVAHPEYRERPLEREIPPRDYSRPYPASQLWRVRRGAMSATAIGGRRTSFGLRYAEVELQAVKVYETFYNTPTFETDTFEAVDGGVRLTHRGREDRQRRFDLPLGRAVPVDGFYEVQAERQHLALPPFDISLEIAEVAGGFDLRLQTHEALERTIFQLECCFCGPGEWETEGQVIEVQNGQTALLKQGHGVFRRGDSAIRIGPGASAHRMWHMRGAEPETDSFRVVVALQAPVDHRLEVRCGRWSAASGALVDYSPAGDSEGA